MYSCDYPLIGIRHLQMHMYMYIRTCTVPLTRKVTNLARRSRDTRETLACQNALLAREHSRALESTRNSKWITRTRTLASILYSQDIIVASRVLTRVSFMELLYIYNLVGYLISYPDHTAIVCFIIGLSTRLDSSVRVCTSAIDMFATVQYSQRSATMK